MRPTKKAACVSAVLLLLLTLLLPSVRWRLIGWAKQESFYDGMPTSYWRSYIQHWNRTRGPTTIQVGESEVITTSSPQAQHWFYTLLGLMPSVVDQPPVLKCDERSIGVLLELTKDVDPNVRASAVVSLRKSPLTSANSVKDALNSVADDPDEAVRREAAVTSEVLKERAAALQAETASIMKDDRILGVRFQDGKPAQLRLTYLGPQIQPTYTVVISTAGFDPGLSLHRRFRRLCWNDSRAYRNDPFQTKPLAVTFEEFQKLVDAMSPICANLAVNSNIPKCYSVSLIYPDGETFHGYEFRVAEHLPYKLCEQLIGSLVSTPVLSNPTVRKFLIFQYCEATGKEWAE